MSAGPTAARVTFTRLEDSAEPLPIPLPPLPVITEPTPITAPPPEDVSEPPVDIADPATKSTGVGGGGADISSSIEPELVQNEFQSVVDTSDAIGAGLTPPTRFLQKPSSEIQQGISARSQAALVTLNSEVEETSPGRLTSGDLSSVIDVSGFVQGLDKLRQENQAETSLERIVIGSTLTATGGLSIGYVLWLLRGEVLLTSLLASLPAWRMIDPLPVLSLLNKRSDEDEDDDSSRRPLRKAARRRSRRRCQSKGATKVG